MILPALKEILPGVWIFVISSDELKEDLAVRFTKINTIKQVAQTLRDLANTFDNLGEERYD